MYIRKKNDTTFRVLSPSTLLEFLQEKTSASRTSTKQLLANRRVQVNGACQTRHDTLLQAGDTVSISNSKGNIRLTHPKLRVVYEDDHLMVVEKREGLLTVPTSNASREMTALSVLRAYVRRQNPRNNVYVVHRLDRETSGLLVFAKTPELQEYMRTWWKEIVTERTYVAVAEGCLREKEGVVRSWFTEDKRHAMVYSSPVDDGGDLAVTHYRVLAESGTTVSGAATVCSLVELRLETGRTNQIRVHLASLGHPVVGDRKYGHGNESSPVDRLCLHARVLEFIHPVTEQKVRFETPVPKDFRRLFTRAAVQ
jgi:23S rRNA pseudouridine1911/1915/1917 synthase